MIFKALGIQRKDVIGMPKFFRIFGIVFILGNIVFFLLTLGDPSFWGIITTVSNIVLGIALVVLGDLVERLSDLESQLNISDKKKEEGKIQQVVCPVCKNQYDMDYPECPYCGRKNDLLK